MPMGQKTKARGYNKEGLDVLLWEVFRGTGRQTGRKISNEITRQISKRTVDSDSKFRKAMDRFEITATVRGSLNKAYKIIDLFQEEYTTSKAILQRTFYLKEDITKIDTKLKNIERVIFTDAEERAYQRCLDFWSDIKEQILSKNA